MGDERSMAGRVQRWFQVHVQSQEYTTTVISTTTPITHIKGNPNHSPVITEYNQSRSLRAKRKSMEHHTTSTPPLRKVLSPKLLSLYNLLGLTSVGWSSLKLSSRTTASVKLILAPMLLLQSGILSAS